MSQSKRIDDCVRTHHSSLEAMPGTHEIERATPKLPSLTVDEIMDLRFFAETCRDWAECVRLTDELAARGVFDRSEEGPRLVAEAKANRLPEGMTLASEKQPNARLAERAVRAIRSRYADGESASVLSRDFGTSLPNICAIVNGQTWKGIA